MTAWFLARHSLAGRCNENAGLKRETAEKITTKMSTPQNDMVEPGGEPTAVPVKPPTYPKWVGLVFAWFLPGAAHFLAGKRWTGILLLLSWPVWLYSALFLFTLPGIFFCYLAWTLGIVWPIFFVGILVSSWRPTRRIGWQGWGAFFLHRMGYALHCR